MNLLSDLELAAVAKKKQRSIQRKGLNEVCVMGPSGEKILKSGFEV